MKLGGLDVQTVQHNLPLVSRSPSTHSLQALNSNFLNIETNDAIDDFSLATDDQAEQPATKTATDSKQQITHLAERDNTNTPTVRFVESEIRATEAVAASRDGMEFDSGPPTPVDDTPYLRFALDQLTIDRDVGLQRPDSVMSDDSYPVERVVPDEGLGYVQTLKHTSGPSLVTIPPLVPSPPKQETFTPWNPVHSTRFPNLTFVPKMLRPFPITAICLLCLLAASMLMYCAIYSTRSNGLVDYTGEYNSQYFVFVFLPQILAAILYVWINAVVDAVFRTAPFTMMASDNVRRRENALFLKIFPWSLMIPRIDYLSKGQFLLGLCSLMLWPVSFSIPLASSLFEVVWIDGTLRWASCLGVTWCCVAIYLFAVLAVVCITIYFLSRETGLLWDPRSLADIISLLPRSNSLNDYQETEIVATKAELRNKLGLRSDRLGYWKTLDPTQDVFYCIGEPGSSTRRYTLQYGKAEKFDPSNEKHAGNLNRLEARGTNSSLLAKVYSPAIRFHYIPWFLSDSAIVLWPIAGTVLLIALLVISFLPSTGLRRGFEPLVRFEPDLGGFSPARFLYSILPSLIGLFLHMAIKTLALALARLTPWAELSENAGATPVKSLLVDYTASFSHPFATISTALSNKHYIIAYLAFLTPLTLVIPVLAGGLFFPFLTLPSGALLILTNLPVFYVILAILFLCVIALIATAVFLLSSRRRGHRFHLPHRVECLAEIISFLYASEIVHDAAFRAVRSKVDLRTRLVGARERVGPGRTGAEIRYSFGIFKGRDGRSHLGVERMGRGDRGSAVFGGGGHGRSRSRFSL